MIILLHYLIYMQKSLKKVILKRREYDIIKRKTTRDCVKHKQYSIIQKVTCITNVLQSLSLELEFGYEVCPQVLFPKHMLYLHICESFHGAL